MTKPLANSQNINKNVNEISPINRTLNLFMIITN